MKKIAVLIAISAFIFGCNSQKKELEKMTAERDSLVNATFKRDSTINKCMLAFNEIERNLNLIKEKEQLINISKPGELTPEQKDQINQDILEIYKLIKKYKSRISKMQKQFKAMNIQIDQMNRMIANLNKEIKKKDEEIEALKTKLTGMNILVDSLFKNIDSLYLENEEKNMIIGEKTSQLNKVFYVIGSKKELTEKGIIDKKGLLGKNLELKSDLNKEYFTQIDLSKTKGIPVFAKKAEVITKHPSSSYTLHSFEDKIDSLLISEPDEFWSISRYCVIVVD